MKPELEEQSMNMGRQVTAKRAVINSQPFLEILVPFKPAAGAIEANDLRQLLMLIVGYSSVDIEAADYYASLNEALRHWSVKGA